VAPGVVVVVVPVPPAVPPGAVVAVVVVVVGGGDARMVNWTAGEVEAVNCAGSVGVNLAVSEWVPVARPVVVIDPASTLALVVALAPVVALTVAVPKEFVPSKNSTEPIPDDGHPVPPPGAVHETVAVSVTVAPGAASLVGDVPRIVEVVVVPLPPDPVPVTAHVSPFGSPAFAVNFSKTFQNLSVFKLSVTQAIPTL
jgi:hypothetical protein